MGDKKIAGDGVTDDSEAIRAWLDKTMMEIPGMLEVVCQRCGVHAKDSASYALSDGTYLKLCVPCAETVDA